MQKGDITWSVIKRKLREKLTKWNIVPQRVVKIPSLEVFKSDRDTS